MRYVDWVMPGVLAMNMMFASLFGIGYVIVRYRQNGVLKRFQATPVSALQFIVAQVASRLMIVVLVNGLIFIGCDYFLNLLMNAITPEANTQPTVFPTTNWCRIGPRHSEQEGKV